MSQLYSHKKKNESTVISKTTVFFHFLRVLTWVTPATSPTRGTNWHQNHCHECEAVIRHAHVPPPCWLLALAAGLRARQRWPSECPQLHCDSGTSNPDHWYSAGHHLTTGGRKFCSFWLNWLRYQLAPHLSGEELTSFNSSIPRQAPMRLDTGHKDWQLPTLTAPPSCDSHAQRLMRFLLHSYVFLFTAHTLRKVLWIFTENISLLSGKC